MLARALVFDPAAVECSALGLVDTFSSAELRRVDHDAVDLAPFAVAA